MTPRFAPLFLTAFLAACVGTTVPQTPPQTPTTPMPAVRACDAEELRYLIGQNKSVLTAMGLQGPVRVIGPDMAVTADFNPNRLNILHDKQGTIMNVGCH